jgi:hypothetical protein
VIEDDKIEAPSQPLNCSQNGMRSHSSRIATATLAKQQVVGTILNWEEQSPDFLRIELVYPMCLDKFR